MSFVRLVRTGLTLAFLPGGGRPAAVSTAAGQADPDRADDLRVQVFAHEPALYCRPRSDIDEHGALWIAGR